MSEHDEPARLIDDTDDALGELLRAATRDLPDDARVDAMLESVLREVGGGDDGGGDGGGGDDGRGAIGGGGGAADGGATAGAKAGGAWLATGAGKLGAALAVAAVGASATVWVLRSSDAPQLAAPSANVLVAESTSTDGSVGASAPTSAPVHDDAANADTVGTATASASVSAPQAISSAARAAPAASTTASAIASATASASNEPADPRAELALLTEARAALSSSPARALSLAEEHARRFPSSQLGQERSALRIQALAALGRTTEARAELDAFRARNPRSAYLPTLEALVAR